MKFIVDAQLPLRLAILLQNAGYDYIEIDRSEITVHQ
jgi:predicted nuclease of predicted toxin-antitoxin system